MWPKRVSAAMRVWTEHVKASCGAWWSNQLDHCPALNPIQDSCAPCHVKPSEVKPSAAGRCIPAACNEQSSCQETIIRAYDWFVQAQATKLASQKLCFNCFASQKLCFNCFASRTLCFTCFVKGPESWRNPNGSESTFWSAKNWRFQAELGINKTMALHDIYISQCASQVDPNKLEICPGSRQATSTQRAQHVQPLDKIETI